MVHISSSQASAPNSQDAAENASPKHTPTPWRVEGPMALRIVADDSRGTMPIADIRGWGHLTGKGHGALGLSEVEGIATQEANSAFIVKAVNSHDALVKALKSLTNEMSGIWDVFEYGLRNEISNTNYAVAREKIVEAGQVLATVGRETT